MKIPNKMKYIEITKFGPAEGLKLSETLVPDISKDEVLGKEKFGLTVITLIF